MVSAEDLERELALVARAAAGDREGLFGPRSVTWRVSGEAAVFLGAGRALLLQLAHPWVAAAIAEHSRTLADPIGRFHRTFGIVCTMVFGTRDQALAAARQLHRRHMTICGHLPEAAGPFAAGSRYCANDIRALTWVYATLIDSAMIAHDLVLPELTAAERERHYAESQLFAGLFGIPRRLLPPDLQRFKTYFDAMTSSDILTGSTQARMIARQLFAGAGCLPGVPQWYQNLTAHLLPPVQREAFGLRYGDAEHRAAERTIARLRGVYRLLPRRLRHVGPYQEAQARMLGRMRPGPATRVINMLWIGKSQL